MPGADLTKLLMAVLISLVLLGAGLWVLMVEKSASTDLQKAATGWIGLIVGYWLK